MFIEMHTELLSAILQKITSMNIVLNLDFLDVKRTIIDVLRLFHIIVNKRRHLTPKNQIQKCTKKSFPFFIIQQSKCSSFWLTYVDFSVRQDIEFCLPQSVSTEVWAGNSNFLINKESNIYVR